MGTPSTILSSALFGLLLTIATGGAQAECTDCKLAFKENKGQWDKRVLFKSEMNFANTYFQKDGIMYQFFDTADLRRVQHHPWQVSYKADIDPIIHGQAVLATFVGAKPDALQTGSEKESGYYNYFLGNDKSKWASNVSAWHILTYSGIYSGVDLRVYSAGTSLKYDWTIKRDDGKQAADSRSSPIRIKYSGASAVRIADNTLVVKTSVGDMIESEPYAYQEINGKKLEVPCQYVMGDDGAVSFAMPSGWDHGYDLVIDPTLIFATYSGSTADNFGYTATYDGFGCAYVAGSVFGNIGAFPVTPGAFQVVWAGGYGFNQGNGEDGAGVDIGITKYAADGSSRIYCTLLGGRGDELPHSMIVNGNGELFVFGTTGSDNFPVTAGAFDTSFNGGPDPGTFYGLGVDYHAGSDIFITHFNAAGTGLLGSTYLGGSNNDGLNYPEYMGLNYQYADEVRGSIDLDANGNVYVASCTRSSDFPTTPGAYQTTLLDSMDGVVVKMSANLSTLIWSTYLGGNGGTTDCYSLVLDNNGNVFVCGGTTSDSFPVTAGAYQTVNHGGRSEGFITLLNQNGNSLLASTFYGTPSYDQVFFVQTDRNNNAYVLGQTTDTTSMFSYNAAYNIPKSGQYISKFNHMLDTLIWSTRFGTGIGVPDISPTAFLVDVCNSVYMAGWGSYLNRLVQAGPNLSTTGLYVTPNAYQPTTDGQDFYVMVMKDDASMITYATYFGSPSDEEHVDGGTSRFDRKGVIYQAVCAGCADPNHDNNFPTYPANVVSHTNNSFNCNNAVFKLDLDLPAVVADFAPPPTACDTYAYQFINLSRIIDTATTLVLWNFGDGDTSTQLNPAHAYTTPGVYTITLIIADVTSCNGADTITKKLIINANDSTIVLDTLTGCFDSLVRLQLGIRPGTDTTVSYRWYPSAGVSDSTIPNPYVTPMQTSNYAMEAVSGNCRTFYRQEVKIEKDSLSVRGDSVLCPNTVLELFAHDTANRNLMYTWSPVSAIVSGGRTDSPYVRPPRTTTFYVTATNPATGCVYRDSLSVTVISTLQNLTVTATPDSIGYGDTSQLSAYYQGATSLVWDPDPTLSSTVIDSPVAWPKSPDTYWITVTDHNGCKVRDSVTVYIKYTPCASSNLYVPNAFSPNNDGKNDKLLVRGNFIQEMYFTVYDRWGSKMFETRDMNTGWDGMYHGRKLDPAVFGWYLEGTCESGEKFFKKGNVTLLR